MEAGANAGAEILVVDDEPDIREVFRQVLELEGYAVSLAADGREAWESLRSAPAPGLILLDLMMPVMNGAELLGLVRADARLESVPVVLVTAFGTLASAVVAKAQGCLPKPVELDELLNVVGRFCRPGAR